MLVLFCSMFKLFTFIWEKPETFIMWLLICVIINEMLTLSPPRGLEFQARVRSNSIMNCTAVRETAHL